MMRKLRAILMRFVQSLGGRGGDREFADELGAHIAMHVEDGVRAGLAPEEARRRALIHLGGVEQTRQAVRERAGLPWIEDLVRDVRFGLRTMARNPGFTWVAVLTLAIGIGATATVFAWIHAVLLQPLGGVTDPSRLVTLETVTAGGDWVPNSYSDYKDFRDNLKLFDGIAVTHPNAFSVGGEEHSDRVWGELVSGNFFSVLGVKAEAGRLFLPSEYGDAPGKYPVAVISDRYWRTHFGADPRVIGTTMRINQHQITVVGVADPQFHGSIPAASFDLWVPYMEQSVLNGVPQWMLRDRHDRNMLGIARIRHGVTMAQARQELKMLADRMAILNADVSEGMSATLMPLAESPHGPQGMLAGPLRILMGVAVLVLLIVCANVANLLMARATVREREFSARMALGARRSRIMRQVLTECLLLTLSGAVLGGAITPLLTKSLRLLMPPGPWSTIVTMNARPSFAVLAFTAGICVVAALAAGLLPALQVARIHLSARLNDGGRSGTAGRGRSRLRSTLVASEVALALVALVGAGVFARGFQQTLKIDPGFDPDHVMLGQLYLSTNGYTLEQRKEFCRRLAESMENSPSVEGIAFSDGVPLGFEPSWWEELTIEGYSRQPDENMNIFRNVVSSGYLPLLKIPIVDGRNFTEQDTESTPLVMVVNETFVHRFFAGRNPIGKQVHGWGKWFRIVGVAKDSKYHYLTERAVPYFYVPFRQVYREDMNLSLYVRTKGEPDSILPTLRVRAHSIDPNITIFDAAPLRDFIGASLYPQKVAASLMGVMSGIAILLAAVGLYSVMAYWVAQRTQEIGVRMALGARPADVLGMVVRQGLGVTLAGVVLGFVIVLTLVRTISSMSFTSSAMGVTSKLLGTSALDPLIYAAAAVLLCAIAFAACWSPARRAASINPTDALRAE
jgi:predicted permease